MDAKKTSNAALQITVTSTATSLLDLLETANGGAFDNIDDANRYVAQLFPTDEIRYSSCGTPTATTGMRILADTFRELRNVILSEVKLISVTGTVLTEVELGVANANPNL